MLVLTPKYGSLIDIDLLKKQKDALIKHRNDIIYLAHCKDINEAYLTFLNNKDKYFFIGYKPKNAAEINKFVKSLGKIDTLDVSWIDVSELNSLSYCFRYCEYVKHIVGLDKWDVSNVRDMSHMFFNCEKLESISDISEWDVSNVNFMYSMFYECKKLNSIGDIGGWDVSNVKEIHYMFDGCKKLESVGDLEQWRLPANVYNAGMFLYSAIKQRPSWYR